MGSLNGVLNTIILLGSLQGFIISSLLYFPKKKRLSNRLLACLLFLMSLASLNLYLNEIGFTSINGVVATLDALIPMIVVMPMGPLIYFYTRSSVDPVFTLSKKDRLHFLPVLIDIVPSLTVIVFFTGVYTHLVKPVAAPWGQFIDDYNVYADIPRWLSITGYLLLSKRELANAKADRLLTNGRVEGFRWLQQFVRIFLLFQAIWLLYLIPYVIPAYTIFMLDTFKWYPVYVPMAVMIYWLGIKGYMVSLQSTASRRHSVSPATLSKDVVENTISLLKKSMEIDNLFLNPALNLSLVSAHTGIPPKTISAVLNQHLHTSFNEFVNQYRVEAFKSKLQHGDAGNLTIAGVAMECGFNSQATFQRTFKEITGMSPSEYRKLTPETR